METQPVAEAIPAKKISEDIRVCTLRSLLELKVESLPWLWEGIMPQQALGFLTGPSESNKSTFVFELATSVIIGATTFLDIPLNARNRKVLIIVTEDSPVSSSVMLKKQKANELPEEIKDNLIFLFGTVKNLGEVEAILKEHKVDLIVIDTWSDCFLGDINNTISVRQNLEPWNNLARKYECFILCLHHSKKGADDLTPNKSLMLGSQGIEAYARVVIEMRRVNGYNSSERQISIVKGNYAPDIYKKQPIIVQLDGDTMKLQRVQRSEQMSNPFAKEYDNETKNLLMQDIMQHIAAGQSQDKIVEILKENYPGKTTPSKGTINKWIQEQKVTGQSTETL